MPKPKPAADDELVVCIESWSAADASCAAGTRLRGSDPLVMGRPMFFIPADSDDRQIEEARRSLYPPGQHFRA